MLELLTDPNAWAALVTLTALEVVLGCDDIDARTAEAWGWVNRALPADELWPFVDRLARRIASFPPHAVAAAKAAIVCAEKEITADLLGEAALFNGTLGAPGAAGTPVSIVTGRKSEAPLLLPA